MRKPHTEINKLRQNAEVLLNTKLKKEAVATLSEGDYLKLINELEVHQIELEMQNEELILAKETAKSAENKYMNLYNFSPSAYLTLSRVGEISDLNISTEQLLKKKRSQLLKSSFGFFVSSDTKEVYNNFIRKIFKTNSKQTCELKLVTGNNSALYVLVNGIVSNKEEKCLLTFTDISKRKHLEYELIKSQKKAEENDRLKSAFLANMSHEIRTPMNGILGFTELLKNLTLKSERQQEFIDIIQKSGIRMLNIINDIISISRIESHQIEISISETNINEQVEYIYNFFKQEATQKKLNIFFKNGLDSENALIRIDKEKIYAVLTNLVKNAIKFTKTGSIELGYDLKGEFLEFYVKDTGYGIKEEQIEIIFERFRQSGESWDSNIEGSGLGLSISKAFVEMLGGKIWVETLIGHGSTFRFTIPYVPATEKKERLQKEAEKELMRKQKLNILVIDDNETSQKLFNVILKPIAANYYKAVDGYEGVEVCRHNPGIDLVLMDINMPEMNGYEATRQIRDFNKEVIIIAQTAFALPEDRERAIEAGCNNYISKPISRVDLFGLINQYLPVYEKCVNDVTYS